jgi:hypothetical protein
MRKPGTTTWAILVSVLTAAGAIATILSFPLQVGLFRRRQPEESLSPIKPAAAAADGASTSQQEIDAWNNAIANRADCDSLRRYVLDYPAGHYVNAAQTILSARREISEERWVAFEFPSNVVASSSLESRTSREAACRSAKEQMMANMTDGCAAFRDQASQYRSVTVVPPGKANCDCQDEAIHLDDQSPNPLWRCSIRGTYSCRGEQLQHVKRFVCN